MSKKSEKEAERLDAIARLRKIGVKPGTTVYTTLESVARSGMSRKIHVLVVVREAYKGKITHEIREVSGLVGRAIDTPRDDKSGALKVYGGGMDMGFHVVYSLGRVMFPKGGALKKTSYSRQVQAKQAGESIEKDGGYLLTHRWL